MDLLAVTEAWLQSEIDNDFIIRDLCPTGYSFHHVPRSGAARGGGCYVLDWHYAMLSQPRAFISHHAFELYKRIGDKRWRIHDCGLGLFFRRKFISFEYIELLLTSVGKTITIVAVYRPPPSTTNGLTPTFFFDELSTLLEQYVTIPGSLIIVGDFNFHVDTCDSETVTTFLQLFDVFNLNQHTNGSTHKDGHTLAGSCHL